MAIRNTARGEERGPLAGDYDVIVCGASFAGLSVARELRGSGARLLLVDRYAIGERQTSACAAPTEWLERLGLAAAIRQRFRTLVLHTRGGTVRLPVPFSFCTFDYGELCALLAAQGDFEFANAVVAGCSGGGDGAPVVVHTDRGDVTAPMVVDALGWKRVLGSGFQPPEAPLSRGLEVHPAGADEELQIWLDRSLVPNGYGWLFPAGDEVRVGIGSFDPRFHVREPTQTLASRQGRDADGYQGNYIPHKLRAATEGPVFFCGDSAGHCIPLSAEGIRTAFYFGIACGRELRAVIEAGKSRDQALADYSDFCAAHERPFRLLLRAQRLLPRVPRVHKPLFTALLRRERAARFFDRYYRIAHPDFPRGGAPVRPVQSTATIR